MPTTIEPHVDFAHGLQGDQPGAFKLITDRIAAGQRIIKLCGSAGTGKTVLMSRIVKWARAQRLDVWVTAPTHKAAEVIRQKLNDDTVDVRTIHALLGLRLEPDMVNDTGGRILVANEEMEPPTGVIFCDEASMVGEVLQRHIHALPGIVWVFIGDSAQLPPVGEGVSELLNEPDVTLRKILRQAAGSEIINLATRIRNGDMSFSFREGGDVIQVPSVEHMMADAFERFQSPEYQRDAGHARILVFRNDRRANINTAIRSVLVDSDDPYVPGEWLVMYSQFSPQRSQLNQLAEVAKQETKGTGAFSRAWRKFFERKEELGGVFDVLHTSEELQIEAIEQATMRVDANEYKVWDIHARTHSDVIVRLPVLMSDERAKYDKALADLTNEAREARDRRDPYMQYQSHPEFKHWEKARRAAWSKYFDLQDTFAQVDYAYCMTTHKAQGSTFDHVYVDAPDLLSAGGMKQRILYTAVTRPAKTLTFYM